MFAWNVRLWDIKRLLKQQQELGLRASTVQKLKWFLYAMEHDNNVSLTCRHFGIARSTFLCWAKRFNPRDILSLEEQSRRPHTVNVSQTPEHVVALIRELRKEHPLMNKETIARVLDEQHGIEISASTVGREIARNRFFFADTPSHKEKRGDVKHDTHAAPDDSGPDALGPLGHMHSNPATQS